MAQKKTAKESGSLKQEEQVTDIKFLFVVRHGDYDRDRNLSSFGADQIMELSDQLKGFINGGKVLLLSSPAPRASQSAQIISEKLCVPVEEHEILWSDNDHCEDFDGLLQIVTKRRAEAEIMILVTHLEYAEGFPDYFASKELGLKNNEAPIPSKGEACLIDCVNKRSQLVSYC